MHTPRPCHDVHLYPCVITGKWLTAFVPSRESLKPAEPGPPRRQRSILIRTTHREPEVTRHESSGTYYCRRAEGGKQHICGFGLSPGPGTRSALDSTSSTQRPAVIRFVSQRTNTRTGGRTDGQPSAGRLAETFDRVAANRPVLRMAAYGDVADTFDRWTRWRLEEPVRTDTWQGKDHFLFFFEKMPMAIY